jgi:uncharacterized membrane protein required for colicin V production
MDKIISSLGDFFTSVLNGLVQFTTDNLIFILPAMVAITALVQVTKKLFKRNIHSRGLQLMALIYGIVYMVCVEVYRPSGAELKQTIVKVIGIGLVFGALNIVLYDLSKWWVKKRKAEGGK